MKILKVVVGIDKSKLIKGNKRLVACGKNFENILKSSTVVSCHKEYIMTKVSCL